MTQSFLGRRGIAVAPHSLASEAALRVLREAHRYIGTQATRGHDMSPAAEWLLRRRAAAKETAAA